MGYYFAQSYGADAYGSSTYQCVEGACETTTTPGAPNTGQYLLEHPPLLVGVILVASVLTATLILVGKKIYRRSKKGV